MPRGNHIIANEHFRKSNWQLHVRTWFDQPGRKLRRRISRERRAVKLFPRPTETLRPIVHAPTQKYNTHQRLGRGFTSSELLAAKIQVREARTIGIAVDRRRVNRSHKSFWTNVQRLKEYKSRLIVFPRNPKKQAKGRNEVTVDEFKKSAVQQTSTILPVRHNAPSYEVMDLKDVNRKFRVYNALKKKRIAVRNVGVRAKVAKRLAEKKALAEKKQ